MRRTPLAIAALSVLGATALPATASATEVQVGVTATALAAPTCPSNTNAQSCYILLTEETAMQTVSDGTRAPDVITQSGDLSAFSVGISSAAKPYATAGTHSLNSTYGGPPEVELTVLRPIYTGRVKRYEVAAEGPVENLTNYQGAVVQFGLPQELPVVKGEVVALTTPTWAPVLSFDLNQTNFNYVQSRVGNCNPTASDTTTYYNPQTALGDATSYGCSYPGTRAEYSATEITTPNIVAAERNARNIRRGAAIRPRVLKRG